MNDLLEKNAQVKHNPGLNSLEVTFTGFVPYEMMVKALRHEYAMIRQYALKKCIIDLREMGIYAPGVGDLIKNEWFAQVTKEGMKKVAFVVPESVFGQQSMNKAHQTAKAETALDIEYFKDLSSAKQWMGNLIE